MMADNTDYTDGSGQAQQSSSDAPAPRSNEQSLGQTAATPNVSNAYVADAVGDSSPTLGYPAPSPSPGSTPIIIPVATGPTLNVNPVADYQFGSPFLPPVTLIANGPGGTTATTVVRPNAPGSIPAQLATPAPSPQQQLATPVGGSGPVATPQMTPVSQEQLAKLVATQRDAQQIIAQVARDLITIFQKLGEPIQTALQEQSLALSVITDKLDKVVKRLITPSKSAITRVLNRIGQPVEDLIAQQQIGLATVAAKIPSESLPLLGKFPGATPVGSVPEGALPSTGLAVGGPATPLAQPSPMGSPLLAPTNDGNQSISDAMGGVGAQYPQYTQQVGQYPPQAVAPPGTPQQQFVPPEGLTTQAPTAPAPAAAPAAPSFAYTPPDAGAITNLGQATVALAGAIIAAAQLLCSCLSRNDPPLSDESAPDSTAPPTDEYERQGAEPQHHTIEDSAALVEAILRGFTGGVGGGSVIGVDPSDIQEQ